VSKEPFFISVCFNWGSKGIPLEQATIRRAKRQEQEERLAIFNGMMQEGANIRRNVVNQNRPTGWGKSTGIYKNPYGVELPKRTFGDGPFMYKGKPITGEEAKKIYEEYDGK
jgi:hypothetical protein